MTDITVSNYKDSNNVAQANEFVRSFPGVFNTVALKTFKLLISCIDTNNPPTDHSVIVTKKQLLEYSGANGKGELSYLKTQLDSLITPVTLQDENGAFKRGALLKDYSWTSTSDLVKCTFHEDVWPYLTDLKKMFLQYNVLQIKNFKSKFSIIIYENLLSYARQFGSKTIKIDIATLRFLTGTEKKYKEFKDFEKNVLKKAKEEINSDPYIEFLFTYEKPKKGHKIDKITFNLKRRTSIEDTLEYTEYPERLKENI